MKKLFLLFAAVFLAFFAAPCLAEVSAVPVLVSDADPAGTNLRAAPSGDVLAVLPFSAGPRIVRVVESKKGWFRVQPFPIEEGEIEGASTVPAGGWMHGSVLALCACASEDGDPWLYAAPRWNADSDIKVPEGTPLRPLERKGEWLKVRTSQNGKSVERWVNEQQVWASVNDLIECQARVVKGWKK